MKKLLALILCVMMFVAVIPTSAFAAGTTGGTGSTYTPDKTPKFQDAADAKKAVTDLGKDIKAMYTAIAADETVFGTAKTIYDMTDSLAKDLLKDTDKMTWKDSTGKEVTLYNEDLVTNVRKGLNHLFGDEIRNYMNERVDSYTDNTTKHVQPDKYLNTFAKAVSSTLTSAKAQKNIEAIVYGLAALSAQKAVNDRADDLYDDIVEWDHWNEFNWGKIKDLDPDGAYSSKWNPVEDTTLIYTEDTGLGKDVGDAFPIIAGAYNIK